MKQRKATKPQSKGPRRSYESDGWSCSQDLTRLREAVSALKAVFESYVTSHDARTQEIVDLLKGDTGLVQRVTILWHNKETSARFLFLATSASFTALAVTIGKIVLTTYGH